MSAARPLRNAFARTRRVIVAVHLLAEPQTLTELADALPYARTSLRYDLVVLERERWITWDPGTGRWCATPAAVKLFERLTRSLADAMVGASTGVGGDHGDR